MKSRCNQPAKCFAAPKVSKGFIMINLSGDEEKQMRAWARECGIPFKLALEIGVHQVERWLKEEAEITRQTGMSINDRQRALVKTGAPEKN